MEGIKYDLFNTQSPQASVLGRTLYLLGTSEEGPVNEPVKVKSLQGASAIFGSDTKGTLVKAAGQAFKVAGNFDLYLMRVTGRYAQTDLYVKVDGNYVRAISFRSKSAGAINNRIKITMDQKGIYFTLPKPNGKIMAYHWTDFPALGLLAQVINDDTRLGQNSVYATAYLPLQESSSILGYNPVSLEFDGGDDGINVTKNELFLALEDAYSILESLHTDLVLPLGVYFDDVHPQIAYGSAVYGNATYIAKGDYLSLLDAQNNNQAATYHGQLIEFCERQLASGCFAHAIIGLKPIDPKVFQNRNYEYIAQLLENSSLGNRYGLLEDRNFEKIDKGGYISIVSEDPVTYAALLASLPIGESPTNKSVPLEALPYEFSDEELRVMADMGVVAYRQSVRRGIVVSSGVTAALPESDMHFVVNVRCVQGVMALVRQSLESLMGEALFDIIKAQEIDKRVNRVLGELVNNKILSDYSLAVSYQITNDSGVINLELLPIHAVERIRTQTEFSVRRG